MLYFIDENKDTEDEKLSLLNKISHLENQNSLLDSQNSLLLSEKDGYF